MARRSAVIIFILMLGLSSLAFSARKLTTPQIRRNTIRINALEIEKIDITEIIGDPKQEGPNEYNMKLGMRRAVSVRDKLLEFGMDPSRIVGVTSKGEEQPVALNSTDEGRALNRRIEFILSKQD